MNHQTQLFHSLSRLAALQQTVPDPLALEQAVAAALADASAAPPRQLAAVARQLQAPAPRWQHGAPHAPGPALLHGRQGARQGQWGVLRGRASGQPWHSLWWDPVSAVWQEQRDASLLEYDVAHFTPVAPAAAGSLRALLRAQWRRQRPLLRDSALGGAAINLVALAISLYSMQVYDRVVPTAATQTLLVLTLGVLGAIGFELLAKQTRAGLFDRLLDRLDQQLAHAAFARLLAVRLDQLPQSVGSLAAQLRGYETVRAFLMGVTSSLLVDAPFAVLFLAAIAAIAGPLAWLPLLFLLLSGALGLYYRARLERAAGQAAGANHDRMGLLVESVDGAELIKANQAGARQLARWNQASDAARASELTIRRISEHAQQLASALQQCAYVALVGCGALLAARGELSMGALIACSILSGRVLAPMAALPGQLVQWAHAKAALASLERLWSLASDPLHPVPLAQPRGQYQLRDVRAGYHGQPALLVPQLQIQPGERIGVLGPVGAGKTTLLRLLSGLHRPQHGQVLLDEIDMAQLASATLAAAIAYVPQEGRLFAGTLRDNLLLGVLDPGDAAILAAARRSGLHQAVIAAHPHGLQQTIHEGGTGLSGGQRQLLHLTRALLRAPRVWLLDEPTAAMDRRLESQALAALQAALAPHDTLVLVTHKPELLALVDRLLVVAGQQIVLDGPKAEVLARLHANTLAAEAGA